MHLSVTKKDIKFAAHIARRARYGNVGGSGHKKAFIQTLVLDGSEMWQFHEYSGKGESTIDAYVDMMCLCIGVRVSVS